MTVSKLKVVIAGSVGAVLFTGIGIGAGVAMADQPHMQHALDALNVARNQLQIAIPDKGGHRENAIHLVDQAINETNLGIQAGGG